MSNAVVSDPSCARCGAPYSHDSRFCRMCGAPLAAPQGAVELRQVTVVASDLVRSTELSGRLDPEDLRDLFDEFRRTVRRVAQQHGGMRVRLPVFGGDAARLVFGHPDAREDSTESAVRCALALVREVAALGRARNVPLELRAGVAFGTAVLDDSVEETPLTGENVVGTVPALAVRLMAEAPPGGVAIDHSTRNLVGRFFDCRDLGVLQLKGFDAPVRGWLVIGETPVESRHEARRAAQGDDRLIGRDGELAGLLAQWRDASAGAGRGVLIVGDAGLGKSRLMRALDEAVGDAAGSRLELHCTERTTNTSLYPVTMLVRRLAGMTAADDEPTARARARELVGRLLDDAARLDEAMTYLGPLFLAEQNFGAGAAGTGESAEQVRDRMIEWVLTLVRAMAARRGPLLIRVEDLQWADATTRVMLRRLLEGVQDQRLMVLVTARPDEHRAADELPHTTVVPLASLDGAAARDLFDGLTRGETLSAAVTEWAVRRAEGVPLYIEELARAVLEAAEQGGAEVSVAALERHIPEGIQNVIQARLDRRPALRNVVQGAAALGREFTLALLHELLGGDRVDVTNAVARLIDDGVLSPVQEGPSDRLRFKHALIHEAASRRLLRSDRIRLHSKVADLLAALAAGDAPPPESAPDVRAGHLAIAGRIDEAAACLLEAAAVTCAKAAYDEAREHCEKGLALLAEAGAADSPMRKAMRRQLLVLRGVALTATRGYAAPEVEASYRQARELCEAHDEPATLYPIVRGLATYHLVRGELALAHGLSVQGLALAERSGRADHRIDALSVVGYASLYTNRLAEARDALERCLALYRAEGGERFSYPVPQDAATAAWALLPTVAWLLGDAHAAEDAIGAGLAHVEKLGRPYDTALLNAWFAGVRLTQRRYAEAAMFAGASMAVAQQFGFREWLGYGAMMFSLAQAALAPAPAHVENVRNVFAGFRQIGVLLNASYYCWGLARALAVAGDRDGARQALDEALRYAVESGETRMNSELLLLRAELEADDAAAAQHLAEALAIAREQQLVPTALRAALALRLRGASAAERESAAATLRMLDDPAQWPAEGAWLAALLGDMTGTARG